MVHIQKRFLLLVAVALSFALKSFAPEYLIHASKWQTTTTAFISMLAMRFSWTCVLYPLYISPLRHLPQPKQTSFFMGQFIRMMKEPTGQPQLEWMENIPNDGLIYYRGIFNQERVMVTTPKAFSEALVVKSYDLIKPPGLAAGLARIVGWGVLLTEGHEHKMQRKNLTPAFSYRHIKDLYPVFWDKSREMILGIDKDLKQQNDGSKVRNEKGQSNTIQVDAWASRATLDIIGAAGIGRSFNAIEDENSDLYQTYQVIFLQDWQTRLIGLLNLLVPFWVTRMMPIPRNIKVERARRYLSKVCLDLLAEKKSRIAAAKEKGDSDEEAGGKDILTVALKSGGFTDDQIVDQLLTFLAAGHETTATAMGWAVYTLGKYPEIQTKLREELLASDLPNIRDTSGQVTAEQISSLPYLQAVLNEILRFYSPVPMTLRETFQDITLAGHSIPKGTTVINIPLAVNHFPAFWSEDPKKFDPERWLGVGRANTGGAESNYANMVFSHGPRGCIGASFAKAEFACLLAAWVLGFETELVDAERKIDVTGGIIRKIKGGLEVKLTPMN